MQVRKLNQTTVNWFVQGHVESQRQKNLFYLYIYIYISTPTYIEIDNIDRYGDIDID